MSSSHKDKGKGRETQAEAVQELANFLSDWHLLVFLDTCGIFAVDDMKLIARIAAKKDKADVQKLVRSPAWRTLVTIAKEHAGELFSGQSFAEHFSEQAFISDTNSTKSGGDVSMGQGQFETDADGFPIIPPDHDMMRTDTPQTSTRPGSSLQDMPAEDDFSHIPDTDSGATGGAGGTIVCPHCTFENPASAVDCDICSLPLR